MIPELTDTCWKQDSREGNMKASLDGNHGWPNGPTGGQLPWKKKAQSNQRWSARVRPHWVSWAVLTRRQSVEANMRSRERRNTSLEARGLS